MFSSIPLSFQTADSVYSSLGPIASDLIGSTICRFISKFYGDVKRQLRQTIKLALLAESARIDLNSEDSSPMDILSISDFINFVLVPEVATYLIAQDMEISYLEAIDIKNDSNEFGDIFQGNTKLPELLSLLQSNIEIGDEEALDPVPLRGYSPIRDWNEGRLDLPSPKSAKNSPSVPNSPKSAREVGSSKPPKVVRKSVRIYLFNLYFPCSELDLRLKHLIHRKLWS